MDERTKVYTRRPKYAILYSMKKISLLAYGKINLTLGILGQEEETGLHQVDTYMQTIDWCDYVTLQARSDDQCTSTWVGREAPEGDTALKAAELFVAVFETNGVDITIQKRLPIGAGLGGSAADAAAVLRGMALLYDVDFGALKDVAASVGADVPFLLGTGLARCTGTGTQVEPVALLPQMYAVVLCPSEASLTADAYAAYDAQPKKPAEIRGEEILEMLREEHSTKLLTVNHLQKTVSMRIKGVDEGLKLLQDPKALHIAMTGAGSAVYALYTDLDAAQAKADSLSEGRLVRLCRLVNER